MKIEVSEKKIIRNMKLYHKINHVFPKEMENALKIGQVFKEAGLRPFYAYDQIKQEYIVTSREYIDKEGH